MANKKVAEIMSKRLVTIEKSATIGEASGVMKEKSIRHLLVIEKSTGVLIGIISDRDLKKMISPFIGSSRETPQDLATATIEVGKVMVPKGSTIDCKTR